MTKNLDPLIEATPANGTITLEPGIWTTQAVGTANTAEDVKRELKEGVTLEGPKPSEGIATIISIRPLTGDAGDASVIRGVGRNTVRNLTVDGGVPQGDTPQAVPYPGKRNLVFLKGDGNVIENVIGRRQYGVYQEGKESFGLSAWGSPTAPSRITNCQVVDVVGDYATAMQATEIRNCLVNFPRPAKGVRAFRAAFNMGDSVNGIVEDCEAWWAMAGVYMDWKSCSGLKVKDNAFFGCDAGLWINAQQEAAPTEQRLISNLTFEGNQVWLNPQTRNVNGILLDHSNTSGQPTEVGWHGINGVNVTRNVIDFLPGETVTCEHPYASNICDYTPGEKRTEKLGICNVRFADNTIGATLIHRTKGLPDVSGYETRPIVWKEI